MIDAFRPGGFAVRKPPLPPIAAAFYPVRLHIIFHAGAFHPPMPKRDAPHQVMGRGDGRNGVATGAFLQTL